MTSFCHMIIARSMDWIVTDNKKISRTLSTVTVTRKSNNNRASITRLPMLHSSPSSFQQQIVFTLIKLVPLLGMYRWYSTCFTMGVTISAYCLRCR